MIHYKEFLFVLSPGDEITDDTFNTKLKCKNIVGGFGAMHSKAHITVRHIPIRNRKSVIGLMNRLEKALKHMPPVSLQTDNFDFFKANYTIYTKIKMDAYVKRWFEILRENISAENKITPHVTVAKTLSPKAFEQLWPYFEDRVYRKGFYVDHLTVLERNIVDGNYRPIRKIYFGSGDSGLNMPLTLFDIPA